MGLWRFCQMGVIFMLLCLLAAAPVVAKTAVEPAAIHETPVVIALSSGPRTLDARLSTDATAERILRLTTLPLMDLDNRFEIVPRAASIVENPNPLTWRFTLRPLMFHNGVSLEAGHVVAYYKSMLDGSVVSPYKGVLADVASVRAVNNRVVEFKLRKPNPFINVAFTRPLQLMPEMTGGDPVGLGPYRITEKDPLGGVRLDLAATWAGKQPTSRTLSFKVVQDPVVRLLKLRRGEAHLTQNDLPDVLFTWGKENGLQAVSLPSATYTYLGFNFEDKVLSDPRVREAIAYAIDRQQIIDTLLYGNADIAESLLLKGHPAFWPAPARNYSPATAQRLLDRAGYRADKNGFRLRLKFSTTNSPSTMLIIQAVQAQLKKVGIELDLNISEWGTFYGNIKKGNFQTYLLTWVGRFQPDIFHTIFHSDHMPPKGANRGRYKNPKMDQLLADLMAEQDAEARVALAQAVQYLQHEEMIYIPLWRRHNLVLMSPKLTGFKPDAEGSFDGLLSTYIQKDSQ